MQFLTVYCLSKRDLMLTLHPPAVKITEKFATCQRNIVHEIPFASGLSYTCQSKQCLNNCLHEHGDRVKNGDSSSERAKHLKGCSNRILIWQQTTVLERKSDSSKRLLTETLSTVSPGKCVSQPSLTFGTDLRRLLNVPFFLHLP